MTEREPMPMPIAFAVEAIACAMTPGALLDGCGSVGVGVVLPAEIKRRSRPRAMKCRNTTGMHGSKNLERLYRLGASRGAVHQPRLEPVHSERKKANCLASWTC